MTISATRRFVDLIGTECLERGSWKIDPMRETTPEAYHIGKEAFMMATLFPKEITWCPYLQGSRQDIAYQSGATTECADLQDVVRRARL